MMLIHRCQACGHVEQDHNSYTDDDCSYGGCKCAKRDYNPEPEAIPTFTLDGDRQDAYIPAGSSTARANGWKACSCERCVELLNDLPLLPFVGASTLGGAARDVA